LFLPQIVIPVIPVIPVCVAVNITAVEREEPGNTISIVSDYRLYDRATEVRSPAEANRFFL
jgi:hypothetical protein